ncbi:MAG: serine/threonine protein kinase, partial [Gemmatimonadaceae bacterium]
MQSEPVAGRYEIIRPLGVGGFARTLLARDLREQRDVALKILRPQTAPDWKAYELFEREGAVLRELRHHGVPAIYETFRATWEGTEAAFLAMEYIDGVSLEQTIADRRHVDPVEVLNLFTELLGVLDYLHTRIPPVLHRDIKPANVIVRKDGAPVLVDFGAVRNVFRAPNESTSTVVGTYGYMPYEQYMGQASPSSDLYALAATFLHLITGRPPSDFMTEAARLEVPESLTCGEPLRRVLVRLLATAPGDRYATAKAARNALFASAAPLVGADAMSGNAVARIVEARMVELSPAPRELTGENAKLLDRVSHSMWELMEPEEKIGAKWTVADVVLVTFFSVVTIGILPAIFWSFAVRRRSRFKHFIAKGELAEARVLDMTPKDTAFGVKLSKVRYEFDVAGEVHRDSDLVLPVIAERWDRGTIIQVLYLPNANFDSVIIST